MSKRYLFLISLILLTHLTLAAQVVLHGKVSDLATHQGISFARVALQRTSDTTQVVYSSVTDMQGSYVFDNVAVGRYRFIISSVGYETSTMEGRISLTSSGNSLEKDFRLQPSITMLEGVEVVNNTIQQSIDHRSIIFTSDQLKRSQEARDLLKTIPEVREDLVSGKLTTTQGSPLLLINGVHATENELRALSPNKVKRVDYYDFPPARYATNTCVINVITKRLDKGYALGLATSNAFTTGFSNDNLFYSTTQGNSIFHLEYDLNYRNYRNSQSHSSYTYVLNGLNHLDDTQGQENFGYTTHNLAMKYSYIQLDKRIFQATFSPNLHRQFSISDSRGVYQKGDESLEIDRDNTIKTHIFTPSIDLYYWQKMGKKDEISANFITTLFNTHSNNDNHESVAPIQEIFFQDQMRLKNDKQSLIAELAYNHDMGLSRLNAGYRLDYSHLFSDLDNARGQYQFKSNMLQQYVYASIEGLKRKLMYQVSFGLTFLKNKSELSAYHKTLFNPQVLLGYSFSTKSTLRYLISSETKVPTINQLSNNISRTSKDLYYSGNPFLKNQQDYSTAVVYNFNGKYLNLGAAVGYTYKFNPIMGFYSVEDDHFIYQSINAKHGHNYFASANISVRPFGTDRLQLKLAITPSHSTIYTETNHFSDFSCKNNFEIDFHYKNLSANYSLTLPTYVSDGIYKQSQESGNDINITYQLKNWKFSLGMLFIGRDATYSTKTKDISLVQEYRERRIKDNKSMILIGVSFNFNSGRNKSISRNLENKDTDVPTF